MAKKVYLTEDEIKQANISDNFKKAVFAAYKYAKTDEKGYFFNQACNTLKYIIGLTDTNKREQNGIEYDNLVDNTASWTEIDNRIINVILDEDREDDEEYDDIKFYEISSWLWERMEMVKEEDFFHHVFNIFKERNIAKEKFEFLKILIFGYSGIIVLDDEKVTSFGKVAVMHFDELWKASLESDDKNGEILYNLYKILELENPSELKERSSSLIDEMIKSGSNGAHYANQILQQNDHEYVLKLAKKDGPQKFKRTAYSIFYKASDTEKDKYKLKLWDIYLENGVDKESAERIIEIWAEAGIPLLNKLYDENSSLLARAVDKLDEQFGEKTLEAYANAFASPQDSFDGAGYLTEHKDFLEKIYAVLSKYDFSEYAGLIIEKLASVNGNDLNAAAGFLAQSAKYVETAAKNKLTAGTDAEKDFANLILQNINGELATNNDEEISHEEIEYTSLEDALKNVGLVEFLNLSNQSITEMPFAIKGLNNLKKLVLNDNQLTTLPDWIGELSTLRSLIVGNNQLTSIPESIGLLSNLQTLWLWENELEIIPDTIGQLKNLIDLSLHDNKLTTIPTTIGHLAELDHLDLSGNLLTQLPETLRNLTKLTYLSLDGAKLGVFPTWICELKAIKTLTISNTGLKSIPGIISKLSNLYVLDLSDNDLEELPSSINELQNIVFLHLNKNKLKSVPASMSKLTSMQKVDLSENNLTDIPASWTGEEFLTEIDFYKNKFSEETIEKIEEQLKFNTLNFDEELDFYYHIDYDDEEDYD